MSKYLLLGYLPSVVLLLLGERDWSSTWATFATGFFLGGFVAFGLVREAFVRSDQPKFRECLDDFFAQVARIKERRARR